MRTRDIKPNQYYVVSNPDKQSLADGYRKGALVYIPTLNKVNQVEFLLC